MPFTSSHSTEMHTGTGRLKSGRRRARVSAAISLSKAQNTFDDILHPFTHLSDSTAGRQLCVDLHSPAEGKAAPPMQTEIMCVNLAWLF